VYFRRDPKILWSIAVWLVYLSLLVARWGFSRTGRPFAWGAIGTFSFILLTFWGFNLLSAVHRP
jgi:ABC-type transport system involved in cytochrome c biogenesis permease subunit